MPHLVVLLCLCFALATAKPAADTSLDLFSAVEQQTTAANKALAVLPAACTRGSARSIQEAKVKMFGDIASCSVSGIIKNIAYIVIDAADFGSTVWGAGAEGVAAVKACKKDTSVVQRVECFDNALDNAVFVINGALRQLFKQLIVIIPNIESEIKTCQGKSTQEYKHMLDNLVKKAQTC